MPSKYTAGSFTKNFSWNHSYERLHIAVRNGFSGGLQPVERDAWRDRSGIRDSDRQLIPMNFFLYTLRGVESDFLMVDRLVELAVNDSYDQQFAKLGLFAFHLANSGNWSGSKWHDGRIAGWANDLIRGPAWIGGAWSGGAFEDEALKSFIRSHVDGQPVTRRKVLTNYRFMLRSAGVLQDGELMPFNFREHWLVDAVQLFWDRLIFDGTLPRSAGAAAFEDVFFKNEIHKLLGCDEAQGSAFSRSAFREYSKRRLANRFEQIRNLKDAGLIAA